MYTHACGFVIKPSRNIARPDLARMCGLLSAQPMYAGYSFSLEPPMRFVFDSAGSPQKSRGYKSLSIMGVSHPTHLEPLAKNAQYNTVLRSYYGAAPFTLAELKIWEACFSQIGISVGGYPSAESLVPRIYGF